MFFLRQLRKFGVNKKILIQFYRAVIESVLTFSITVWYGSASVHDKNLLDGIVGVASKLTGCELPSLESIYTTRTQRKVRCTTADEQHPAHYLLQCLPSERHFRTIKARTSRFKQFLPQSSRDCVTSALNHHTVIFWPTHCKPDDPDHSVCCCFAVRASKSFALVTWPVLLFVYFYLVLFYYF